MERRTENRIRTVYRPAYIQSPKGPAFAIMRNISPEGACFSGQANAIVGEYITYAIGDSDPIEAEVVWIEDSNFGVRNVEAIEDLNFCSDRPYRSVRLPLQAPVKLYVAGNRFEGIVRNVSQQGVCIDNPGFLSDGQLITIEIGGLEFQSAVVKWANAGRAGVRFATPLDKVAISQVIEKLSSPPTGPKKTSEQLA